MADRLTALLAPEAEERRKANLKQNASEGKTFPVGGRTREKVAPAVGMSHPTLGRARAVVRAADAGDPVAQEALAEMGTFMQRAGPFGLYVYGVRSGTGLNVEPRARRIMRRSASLRRMPTSAARGYVPER